jgi:hypothetical protein
MQNSDCPNCRVKVTKISKNHIIDNLIKAYIKNNPEKARSESCIKELDLKNKITQEMVNLVFN